MAENKMTLDEAIRLANEGDYSKLDNAQLSQMNQVLNEAASKEGAEQDLKDTAEAMVLETETRLAELNGKSDFAMGDLDSIIDLASSVSGFSKNADLAKAVLEKATNQKENPTAKQKNEAALDEILASDQYTDEEKDLALDAAMEYNNEIDAQAAASEPEFEVGETVDSDAKANEEQAEDISVNEGAEAQTQENQHDAAESEASGDTEGVDEEKLEEAENIPEDEAALEAFDKEYGIDTMTAEQLEKNAEVMDASEFNPFELNEDGNLVHPEFQAEYEAIQNLEITNDEGEPLPKEEQEKAKASLLETAVYEAGMLTRGTARGDEDAIRKQYKENLKSSLQKAVVTTAFASEIEGKPKNRENYGAAFAKATSQEGGVKTSLKNIIAYAGVVNGEMTKLKDRLQNKFKEIPAVKKMSAKIAAFDKSMDERFGKKWRVAKRIGNVVVKRAKGVAMYSIVGATAGPIGLTLLAVKSGYDSCKALDAKAAKEGMTLKQYAKTHKMEVGLAVTTSGLSLLGSTLGLGVFGSNAAQTVSPYLKNATRALAIAPKAAKAAFHGLKAAAIKMGWKKGNVQEELAAAKAALGQTFDATIGMVAGSYMNEGIQDLQSHDDNQVDGITGESVSINSGAAMGPETPEAFDARMAAEAAAFDKDGDGIPDVLDIDHGKGWATANGTQLDRLMDADPRGVNAILNDGNWHSSAELRDMMDNGKFTEDQLKAIHDLASREFDSNGHIIDKDLNKLYEDLARQAAVKAEPQETPEENKGQETPLNDEKTPPEVGRTPEEQKMYDSIMATISKGEDMNDPAIRASVEALAEGYLNDVKGALDAGNEQAAVNILHGIHKQGEAAEVQEATQREDDDSRGVRHAKEDLAKVSGKLDEAKAALAADPNNENLQREVEKLEKEFDKKSLNLDNKEIKQERSELKDQINRDNKSAENLDWTRGELEKIFGVSQEAADKQLAAAGFDLKNLPENTDNLPENIQNLINAHNQYAQVDQTEAALHERVGDNEQRREDLKEQEKENKEAMKEVKKGHGFSTDDERRASIEERLPGQSDFRDSELASSLVNMTRGGNEPASQEQNEPVSSTDAVDKFLQDQVAQGKMSEDEAAAQREDLIKAAALRQANEAYAEQLANPDNWQEYQAQIEPNPLQGKPETAPVYHPENEGETLTAQIEPNPLQGKPETAPVYHPENEGETLTAQIEPNPLQGKPETAPVYHPENEGETLTAQIEPNPLQGKPETAPVYHPENEGETLDRGTEPAAATPEKEAEDRQEGYRTDSLQNLKADYLEDIEKNHGLENVKTIVTNGQSYSTNGVGHISLAMINSADNGYAMISQEGAESFVIDYENKTMNFRVGSGDDIRNMSYSEAKEFTETIMDANNSENPDECILKYQLMLMKLYEMDKDAYAQDLAQDGTLKTYANTLGCGVDSMRELHHENDAKGSEHTISTEENTGQEPKPEENSGQEPKPEENSGQEPKPEENSGQEPKPEENSGQEPKQEENSGQEPKPEEKTERQEAPEVTIEPLVAETKAGNITYGMDDNGKYQIGGTISVINDHERYKDIEKEISAGMGNTSGKSMIVGHKAQVAYMADAINKDIEARMARGEDVPHGREMMELNNRQLKAMGLEYDKDGHLHSSRANGGHVQTRGGRD